MKTIQKLFVLGFIASCLLNANIAFTQNIVLYEEDFESYATGEITSTASVYPHQIDGAGNTSTEKWEVSTSTSPTCTGCTNKRARVQYGSSGTVNENTLVLGTFENTYGTDISANIEFDYAFKYASPSVLQIDLYDETLGSVAANLVTLNSADDDASYSASHTLTNGHEYSIRAFYYGEYNWYASIDNILVSFPCTGTAPTFSVTKTCIGDYSTFDLEVDVTSLGSATNVDITDGTTTYESAVGSGAYTISGLSSDLTLMVIDHDDAVACYNSEVVTACDICADAPSLPEDECADAPIIDLSQPFNGSTSCSYTVSAGSPDVCGQSVDNDSWMRFIAADTEIELDYTIGDCANDDGIQLAVFSGTCGSLVNITGSCVSPSGELTTATWNFSGLTIGSTYYIRIDGYAGDLCDYYFEPVAGVVITPDNDECANAMTLTCGDSDIASNILATDTDAPSACSGGGTTSKGVWYQFTGTGQEVTISTDNAGTNFDTQINVFSGTCGSLVCEGGDDDSGTGTSSSITFVAANGTDYYIYVDGDGAAEGQFEISLTCVDACNANPGTWQY